MNAHLFSSQTSRNSKHSELLLLFFKKEKSPSRDLGDGLSMVFIFSVPFGMGLCV